MWLRTAACWTLVFSFLFARIHRTATLEAEGRERCCTRKRQKRRRKKEGRERKNCRKGNTKPRRKGTTQVTTNDTLYAYLGDWETGREREAKIMLLSRFGVMKCVPMANIYLSSTPRTVPDVLLALSRSLYLSPMILGLPPAKKKRVDPALDRSREEKKKKKLEKALRKMNKKDRIPRPIKENEVQTEIKKKIKVINCSLL